MHFQRSREHGPGRYDADKHSLDPLLRIERLGPVVEQNDPSQGRPGRPRPAPLASRSDQPNDEETCCSGVSVRLAATQFGVN